MSPPCRKKGETTKDCVARKIPELAAEHPDWSQDQVVAVAYSMCSKRCRCTEGDEMREPDLTGVQHRAGMTLRVDPSAEAGDPSLTTFLASDDTMDRWGTRIVQDWLDNGSMDAFDRNPVVPWSHDYQLPPLGQVIAREVRDVGPGRRGLVITVRWDMDDPQAALIAGKYARGVLSAVSVGFRSEKVTSLSELDHGHPWYAERGYMLSGNELLEVSAVTVPGNANAVAMREAQWMEEMLIEQAPAAVRTEVARLLREDAQLRQLIAEVQAEAKAAAAPTPEPSPWAWLAPK